MVSRAVVVEKLSSTRSIGRWARIAKSSPIAWAASAEAPSPPSSLSGSPTTSPTGCSRSTSVRNSPSGGRLPARRLSVVSGEAISWVSSVIASPMRAVPQSRPRTRPLLGIPPIGLGGSSSGCRMLRPYWAILAKNSLLDLVGFIRPRRNSIASTTGISARKLRSRYTLLSSSLLSNSSSLRVPDLLMSIAG